MTQTAQSSPIVKIIVALLILGNLFAYFQHIPVPSDVWFFWLPFLVLGLYLAAWNRMGSGALKFHPVSES